MVRTTPPLTNMSPKPLIVLPSGPVVASVGVGPLRSSVRIAHYTGQLMKQTTEANIGTTDRTNHIAFANLSRRNTDVL